MAWSGHPESEQMSLLAALLFVAFRWQGGYAQPVRLCNQNDIATKVVVRCHGPTLSGSLGVDKPLVTDIGVLARRMPPCPNIIHAPSEFPATSRGPSKPTKENMITLDLHELHGHVSPRAHLQSGASCLFLLCVGVLPVEHY